MKKFILLFTVLILSVALVACSSNANEPTKDAKGKPVVTVTTTFLDDMVYQLAGDWVDIKLIIPAGEDPHLYLAKPEDLNKIKDADLLLYHGLHFEGKMLDALEPTGKMVTQGFDHSKLGEMEQDGEMIIDPHFWFNIELYKQATENASKQLQTLLPDHAAEIKDKTTAYLVELDKLHEENKKMIAAVPKDQRFLITPHDAFNYFSRSYGVTVVAPQGVSTDTEVSNQDITKTVDFIVEHKVKAIFAESTTDPARMDKLKESCKAKGWDVKVVKGEDNELLSDSLAQKGHDGDTYIDMYRHNVKIITENLK